MDPLANALMAAIATSVDPGELRALVENAALLRPLRGRGFQVWELAYRVARSGKLRHYWRLGPYASGLYTPLVPDLDASPPGTSKAGFREVMEALRSPGQPGCPPSVATDTQLGFSVMAYQSAEVLFGHILVRLLGTCARAPKAGRRAT